MTGQHIFTGTAGVYYVMHKLAVRRIHAACTHGNAPDIDILASTKNGRKTVAIQVKTTDNALRFGGRGEAKAAKYLDFPLGHSAATKKEGMIFFAFVDLRVSASGRTPDVYVYPSDIVSAAFVQEKVATSKMIKFLPRIEAAEAYKNEKGFEMLERYLYDVPNDTDDLQYVRQLDDADAPHWYAKPLTKAGESIAAGLAQDASRVWPCSQ